MWEGYRNIAGTFAPLSLTDERKLIAKAQKGCRRSAEELVLRHVGFVMSRLRRMVFPELLHRFGEDLLSDAVLVLYDKVETYDLKYRDREGRKKPVKFISYIWKRIDGFILDTLRHELKTVAWREAGEYEENFS